MKTIRFLIVTFLFTSFGATTNLYGQLALNTTMTPNQLVQNVLVGSGVTITNVTYTGDLTAIADFSNGGTTNLGLQKGIMLCSGKATLCVGPNNSSSSGFDNTGVSDPQLASLITQTVYDAAVLEFDFSPLSDTIMFRYVFGSDEYHEFVNSGYNDVFGFFISGANPLGGNYLNHNIAIIPGTANTPVSINNVNAGYIPSNSAAFPGTSPSNSAYFIANGNGNGTGHPTLNSDGLTIQYDGLTTVLTAWCLVTPCTSYHFKIAIGDAGDGAYDSGVFLEENSFRTNAITVETEYSVPGAGKVAIEGCNDAIIKFKIPKHAADTIWIHFDSIFGTAVNGVDFPLIPDSIAILPGQSSGQIIVSPYVDGVIEGIEFLKIITKTSICTTDTLTVPINDYTPMSLNVCNDTMVCNDTANLWVIPSFGAPPYTYSWSPPIGLTNLNVYNPKAAPPMTTTYIIEVDDTTGCPPVHDTVVVTVNQKPSISFMPDILSGCEPLTVTFTDYSAPSITTWNWDFGDGGSSTSQNPSHTYNAGNYSVNLAVKTLAGCSGSLIIPNLIHSYPSPHANFTANPPVTNIDNPTIKFSDISTNSTQWEWDFGDGGTSTDQNPEHTYNEGVFQVCLKVISPNNCTDSVCHEVMVIIDEVEIPNVITPNGDGINDYFHIVNIDKIPESTLIIFNRWGRKIYEMDNYQNDWDGEGHSDGVYYYILKYKTYFKEEEINGTVTIMRE
ncbi:MAG: choice-of-anchor L domain-containing protein [Saprospiraceae bacterium]|nr:choice-of-anchor L domain-containing protein [Saprospiraceae bacterium]